MTGNNIQTEGFVERRKDLEQLLMTNKGMEEKVQAIIRKVLAKARSQMTAAARSAMDSDPRDAYKAVRTMVYRQILGGNINILNKKKAGSSRSSYEPKRTLRQGQVGGNRRLRSQRTEQVDGYMGSDRGFILRFVNAGTKKRSTRYGNRGAVRARNFFGNTSQRAMQEAAAQFSTLIDQLIKETIGNG